MDAVAVWLHRVSHHDNAFRRGGVPEQPGAGSCACCRNEEYCVVWYGTQQEVRYR
jgi:hypothetical protein